MRNRSSASTLGRTQWSEGRSKGVGGGGGKPLNPPSRNAPRLRSSPPSLCFGASILLIGILAAGSDQNFSGPSLTPAVEDPDPTLFLPWIIFFLFYCFGQIAWSVCAFRGTYPSLHQRGSIRISARRVTNIYIYKDHENKCKKGYKYKKVEHNKFQRFVGWKKK